MKSRSARQYQSWKRQNGEELSDAHLRIVSKCWDANTWAAYLNSRVQSTERSIICPLTHDRASAPPEVLELHERLKEVSPQLRLVLHLRFWDSLSIAEIAARLNQSWEETDALITTALKQMKQVILASATVPLCEAA